MAYEILKGIRILDLTMVFSGPVATRILASMGAEVIKIESAPRPDVFTRANVYPENNPGDQPWNRGSFFHTLNAGKKGITLNLSAEAGRDLFRRLVKISDVVIENYSPRVMGNWGLNYEELKKINPGIIMASLSGLGHYGPLKDFYMFVPGLEGMSGLTHFTGYPEAPPMLSGYSYGDWVLGATAAAAAMVAIFHKKRTGEGQYVDVAGREAVACNIGELLMDFTLNGHEGNRMGNSESRYAPYGCYKCRGTDNWVNISVLTEEQWKKFCIIAEKPELSQDARFVSAADRLNNRKLLDTLVEDWTSDRDKFEVTTALQNSGIPAGAVLNMKELNTNPHLIQRGFFDIIQHGKDIGKRPLPKQLPVKIKNYKAFKPKRAPGFGEDNIKVFQGLLQLSSPEYKELKKAGVIGGAPTFPPGKSTRVDLIQKQGAGEIDPEYRSQIAKAHKIA